MTLHCIDKTAGELVLCPGLLQTLRRQARIFNLYTANDYGPLFTFVQPDAVLSALTHLKENDLYVYVISRLENLEGIPDSGLCFPILPEAEAQRYHALLERGQVRGVPLDASRERAQYVCGDLTSLQDLLARRQTNPLLNGRQVLISAGPTAEDLDPVRYLTNRSSGKMGIALARAAYILGAQVRLVLGATSLAPPLYLSTRHVRSAAQMAEAIFTHFPQCDVYVGAAAIADFRPQVIAGNKIKKKSDDLRINLKRTVDILTELGKRRNKQFLVGFSVETSHEIENSLNKLKTKNLDMIVVNNPKEAGAAFAVDTNRVTVLYADGRREKFPLLSKQETSRLLWQRISHQLAQKK